MSWNRFVLTALLAGVASSAVWAQASGTTPSAGKGMPQSQRAPMPPTTPGTTGGLPPTTTPGTGSSTGHGRNQRQEPCWEVAGVSKTAMQQRRALAQQARQEIQSVCANSSMSQEQKRERIRQIREQEHQQADALVTPQQEAAIRACQQERGGHGHGGGGHMGSGGHGGPCGSMPGFGGMHDVDPTAEPPTKD